MMKNKQILIISYVVKCSPKVSDSDQPVLTGLTRMTVLLSPRYLAKPHHSTGSSLRE